MKTTLVKAEVCKSNNLKISPKHKYKHGQKWEIVNDNVHWLSIWIELSQAIYWWIVLGLFKLTWRNALMDSLKIEHVWAGEFNTYNPRNELKDLTEN